MITLFLLFPNTQYPMPESRREAAHRSRSGIPLAFSSHAAASPSLGARQSPRGESDPPEPTLGPLGMQERLNWLVWKNRWR